MSTCPTGVSGAIRITANGTKRQQVARRAPQRHHLRAGGIMSDLDDACGGSWQWYHKTTSCQP